MRTPWFSNVFSNFQRRQYSYDLKHARWLCDTGTRHLVHHGYLRIISRYIQVHQYWYYHDTRKKTLCQVSGVCKNQEGRTHSVDCFAPSLTGEAHEASIVSSLCQVFHQQVRLRRFPTPINALEQDKSPPLGHFPKRLVFCAVNHPRCWCCGQSSTKQVS